MNELRTIKLANILINSIRSPLIKVCAFCNKTILVVWEFRKNEYLNIILTCKVSNLRMEIHVGNYRLIESVSSQRYKLSSISAHQRLGSACASAQSDQIH